MPVGDRRSGRTGQRSAVARHPALRGTRREENHPHGWGLRRRGPAGRCAGTTGRTGQRSAFPCGRRHLDRWGSRVGLHFHSKGGAALTLAGGGVVGAGFALPRDAGRRPALQAVPALLRGSAVRGFAALSGCDAGPHRENRPEVGSTRSPRPYESAVPRWCTSRCPSHYAERRAGKGTPTSGRHSPPQAGGGKDPEFGGGSPLGRDPGVQRHPGGWVVHALRCASRSGADRRSAFPCLRRHPDCWGFRRGCIFTATAQRSAQFSRWGLPCLRVAPPGGMGAMRQFSVRVAPSATRRALPRLRNPG